MPFNLSNVKKITIPVGSTTKDAKAISLNSGSSETTIWKGTWLFTINIGEYVSKVKYSTDNSTWTEITSNTTVEIDSGKILYVQAVSYDTNDVYWDYTQHNFSIQFSDDVGDDGGSITVYQTRARHYYTNTINAGDYISTLKAKVGDGSWTSASSSVSITHLYEDTVYWELVSYNTNTQDNTTIYTYTGDTSGSFTTFTDNKTINRTLTTSTRYYTATVTAGNYVSKVRIRVTGGSWQEAGRTCSVQKTYDQKIYWEATEYSTTNELYSYDGDVSGSATNTGGNWSATISRTRATRYYTTTVSAGDYVSTVRVKVSSGSWTSASSSVSVTHTYNQTIYWEAINYDTNYSDNTTNYSFSGSTSGNFASGQGTTYTVNRSRSTSTRYYTTTVYAGDYVSTVKAGTSTSYSSGTGSSVSVTHQYNETIYWALVSYDTDYSDNTTNYSFSGDTSGSFSGGSGTTYTANRSRSTSTRYYTSYVYRGDYCSQVRARADSGSWTSWTSGTASVTHQYNETVYWEASANGSWSDDTYTYTYSGATVGNFNGGTGNSHTPSFSQNSTYITYYTTVYAGDYVSTVRAYSDTNGNWTSASSSVTVAHHYNEKVYWQAVGYNTTYSSGFYTYTYSGDTSGNFEAGKGTTYTVNRSLSTTHRNPQAGDFNIVVYNDDDGEDDYYHGLKITNNFDNQLSLSVSLRYNYTVVYSTSSRTVNGNGGTYSEGSWGYGGSMSYNRAVINWTWGDKSGTITKDL